eukprot:COSAG05_NODE_17769_length_319_cov_1.140909_1_plen_51_part_10
MATGRKRESGTFRALTEGKFPAISGAQHTSSVQQQQQQQQQKKKKKKKKKN